MADIELVIKLSKGEYEHFKKDIELMKSKFIAVPTAYEIIANGKPLSEVIEGIKALEQKSVLDKIKEEINSSNRGTCDYFIVDRIEEIIDKYKAESKLRESEE